LTAASETRPRSTRLPRHERRRQLLDAALEVFVTQGYHAAAMDEIAAIKSVIAAGKTPTRAAVRATVATSKYNGLIGPITFDQNGDNTTPPSFAVYTCDTHGQWTYQANLNA